MKKIVVSVLIVSCAFAVSASAATRKVPSEYPSIQMAIQDCNDGDTVLVAPGVYYETINFGGKNITVTGTDPNDPKIVGYTIIDADGDGSVVTFENGETSAAVLTGFTITGGLGTINNTIEGGHRRHLLGRRHLLHQRLADDHQEHHHPQLRPHRWGISWAGRESATAGASPPSIAAPPLPIISSGTTPPCSAAASSCISATRCQQQHHLRQLQLPRRRRDSARRLANQQHDYRQRL